MEEMICNTTFCQECKYFELYMNGDNFTGWCKKHNLEVLVTETCVEAEKHQRDIPHKS